MSLRKACDLLKISRRSYYHKPKRKDDGAIKQLIQGLAQRYPRYGYWKLYHLLRQQGVEINHKRVYRLYKELNLAMRRKTKKRLTVPSMAIEKPKQNNLSWSIDFMTDSLQSGRRFRTFNVLDDFNREALGIEIDYSLPGLRIVRLLDEIAKQRGYPRQLRCDNGPELRSTVLAEWANQYNVKLCFIQPGKPTQNALIERFNGTYRREILDAYLFRNLNEVRHITRKWIDEYNHVRPHAGIGNIPPCQFQNENILLVSGNTNGD